MRMRCSLLFELVLFLTGYKDRNPVCIASNFQDSSPSTKAIVAANAKVLATQPVNLAQDFIDKNRNYTAKLPNLLIGSKSCDVLWYRVNPDSPCGLFKVADKIYQLRCKNLQNVTIIEGQTGWILVDPSTAKRNAAETLDFVRQHINGKPVSAIIYTHHHIGYFGGSLGVISTDKARKCKLRIIAPQGFIEQSTGENIIASAKAVSRAVYMFGKNLEGFHSDCTGAELGDSSSLGPYGILAPEDIINHSGQSMTIDGVDFIFQHIPKTGAPAEITFYLPDLNAFCGADIALP